MPHGLNENISRFGRFIDLPYQSFYPRLIDQSAAKDENVLAIKMTLAAPMNSGIEGFKRSGEKQKRDRLGGDQRFDKKKYQLEKSWIVGHAI